MAASVKTQPTRNWRAVEVIGLFDATNLQLQILEADSGPEWDALVELNTALVKKLLAMIYRREPDRDELESVTRCDFTDDLTKLQSRLATGMSLDDAIDSLIKEWL